MYQKSILALCCAALSACGDPLAKVERLSDVPVADGQTTALVLPADDDDTEQTALFGGLFSRASADPAGIDNTEDDTRESAAPLLRRSGPDSKDVALGTVLPFGEVASVCGARGSDLGKEIDRFPKRGKGYRLFDSDPASTAPHTFYITGFSDGCARQFTAALAVFGAPSMYEQLRYGPSNEGATLTNTDKAYDGVKARLCGKPRGKPCGGQIRSIERSTVFISTYERFSDNAQWADMLIHNGAVLASTVKSN